MIMKKHPIIILHGWGLSGEKFLGLKEALIPYASHVYVPDFPGFGKEKLPDMPLTLQDYAEFLIHYIKENIIVDPIIIGHSFGGRVALKAIEVVPTLAQKLILTGTPGFTSRSRNILAVFVTLAKIGKLFFKIPIIHRYEESIRRWYYYTVGAREYTRAEGAMKQTFKNVVNEPLLSSMQSVQVPCLLAWGHEDIIVPVSIARRMNDVIPGSAFLTIPDSDHGVPYKNPEAFVRAILVFLQS